jgi:aspartyl-tRNA(Asn)/glutamyl-tRNA(Gln) amidotransferase subunit B
VPLVPHDEWIADVRRHLPVLPAERRARLATATGMTPADVALVVELGLDTLVLGAVSAGADARLAVNRAANEVAADIANVRNLTPDSFTRLVKMEADGALTATQSKQVLAALLAEGGEPEAIAKARGFEAMAGDELAAAVDAVVAGHPAEWERFKAGDQKVTGFFVGQVMKATGGKADGKAVTALLRKRAAGNS